MSQNSANCEDNSLDKLIEMVNSISRILEDHGIAAKIDFDHRDKIVIIKYMDQMGINGTTCVIINGNNKSVNGIDESKLWLPDYNKLQAVNRKILDYLQSEKWGQNNG